jgi:uncharacterized protein YdaU (DUF1376 family)
VNYYEHHLNDFAEATAHLSFVEVAAYSRLIWKYYATERPLPPDLKDCQRLVGARTKDEKLAVQDMLTEIFSLEADGFHNKRCDEELERFREKQRKARRSAEARWKPGNRAESTADEMRSHAKTDANASTSETAKPMRTHSERNANGMLRARETHNGRNALQTPDSRLQSPDVLPPSSPAEEITSSAPAANGEKVDLDHGMARGVFEQIQQRYPQGLHRGDHWLKAERAVYRLLEAGESAATLIAAAEGYASQQLVLQNTGSERVMRPNNFFEGAAWRGPFPTPKTATPRHGRKTYDDYEAERRARETAGGPG